MTTDKPESMWIWRAEDEWNENKEVVRFGDYEALKDKCRSLEVALAESRANDKQAMAYLTQIRELVGGDDLPDMVEKVKELQSKLDAHKASRIAYASEFPLGADGMPDVGSIHENIRLLKKDAEFGRSVLEAVRGIVGGDSFPEMIGRVKELQIERNGYKLVFKEQLEKSERTEENRE